MKTSCPYCGTKYDVDAAGHYTCVQCNKEFDVAPETPATLKPVVKIKVPVNHSKLAGTKADALTGNSAPKEHKIVEHHLYCPWCNSEVHTHSDGNWACSSCQHMYQITNSKTKRMYRIFWFWLFDFSLTAKWVVIWTIILFVMFIVLYSVTNYMGTTAASKIYYRY